MRLVVFGASGGTGREIIKQALDQGHEVTAFVRDPKRLVKEDRKLHIIAGDVRKDQAAIATAITGVDAIICTLGRAKSLKSTGLIAASLAAIVLAAQQQGVRRLILISAFGVGDSYASAPVAMRLIFRLLLADIYCDKKVGEDLLKASGLDWTIIRPVMLTSGSRTSTYRSGERLYLSGIPKISRADVAHFALTQLVNTTYLRKTVAISA